ncbi:MAG: hypothetical protein ACTSO9_17045 [Candidatus Helarchaeota archaeon]
MEELFKAMEEKISNLKKLSEVMNEMRSITEKLKEDFQKEQSFKDLIDVNELDEWAFGLIKNLQEIDREHAVEIGKAAHKLAISDLNYVNWGNLKKALSEHGIEVVKDDHVKNFFNNTIEIAIKYFISKQKARKKAKDLVEKSRKKIKTKRKIKKKIKK